MRLSSSLLYIAIQLIISATFSIFKNNDNLNNLLPAEFESHFGISGTVVGIRFPVTFNGENVFQYNLGGGVNVNHARVNIQGHMKLYNNQRSGFGGAVRLGELTLVRYVYTYSYIAIIIDLLTICILES